MINWTIHKYKDEDQTSLIEAGYEIENAMIEDVDLSMADYGVFSLSLVLKGSGWGCVYGGYVIGSGYLGADEFEGSAKGMESIMRIMDVVGVSKFNDMKGRIVRVAVKGLGSSVKIIGNVLKDNWFDIDSFFKDKEEKDS